MVAEMVGEGVLGLGRQRDPVDQEQDAGDGAGLEQALDEGRGGARLAGPGRHLDQQLAPPARDFVAQRLDASGLMVPARDGPVDRDRRQVAPDRPDRDPALQVVLRIEAGDPPRMGVRVAVQEPYLLAVRQEDEGDGEPFRVVDALVARRGQVGARALGLDDGHRAPGAVAERVIGARPVGQRGLEQNARAVGRVPAGVPEQRVDPDAGERFGPCGHGVRARG